MEHKPVKITSAQQERGRVRAAPTFRGRGSREERRPTRQRSRVRVPSLPLKHLQIGTFVVRLGAIDRRLPGSHVHPEGSAVPNGPERPLPATTLGTSRAHPALSFAPLPSRHRNGPGKAREELRRGGAQLRPASVSPRESFTLSVASFNRRAITVYERVGFATVHVFSQWTHGAEWESSKRNDLPSASCRARASSS
jgi:hypothetical protein